MKNYVKYQFKKSLLPFGVVLFAGILFYVMPLLIPVSYNFSTRAENVSTYLAVVLIAACIIMPLWTFRYKMNRRSIDLYYSLPIQRHKLLIIHYLSGFAAIVAGYTLAFWIGFIVVAVKADGFFLINYLWIYLASVPCAYIVYSIYSFAYTRANNIIDGLMFMLFATCALLIAAVLVYVVAWNQVTGYHTNSYGEQTAYTYSNYFVEPFTFTPFSPLYVINEHFASLAVSDSSWYFNSPLDADDCNYIVSIVLNSLLSVACTVGMVMLEIRSKSENCEQHSDSPFGYKVMIPLFMVALCADVVFESDMVVLLIVIAAGYFVTAIWKRSLKIGWKALLVLVISVAVGILYGVIANLLH